MTSNKKTKWVVGIFEYLTLIFIALSPAIIVFSAGVIEGIIEEAVEHHSKHKDNV